MTITTSGWNNEVYYLLTNEKDDNTKIIGTATQDNGR